MEERMTNQLSDGGSIPTYPLLFSRCTTKDIKSFVREYHYSKSCPTGDYVFKACSNDRLVGGAVFGYMGGNPHARYRGFHTVEVRELKRLVLLDEVPKNSESKFIAWCLRWLRKNTKLKIIVSFADPEYGHVGVVYKASNWIYDGVQKPDRPHLIVDGLAVHPRTAVGRYGTSSVGRLRSLGHIVTTRPRIPKFRYLYIL